MAYSTDADEIFPTLQQIVSDTLRVPIEQVTRESALSDLGMVESIKLLRVAGKIERRFDIELDDSLFFQGVSMGRLVDEIAAQRAAAVSGEAA
ncbi:acyl carrier protein [Streptomyces carpaticus]|uniref:Acyl carrier protein n=2 Tax=Streptomyces TaxID=1883 RepID=A0A1I6RJ39_9ACTN|nr:MULTISPECIES: acyl carrier protein [Streptomyces]MCK1816377.1 acyl carrier protein [Streptomyces sp. XM4011]UWM48991.1 acyl carrier protein [Streptomyces carpaticus]SFS64656.1 Acyl carrier protein [Streptomyces harbinensis]